jgi:hypothetical protein
MDRNELEKNDWKTKSKTVLLSKKTSSALFGHDALAEPASTQNPWKDRRRKKLLKQDEILETEVTRVRDEYLMMCLIRKASR